MAAVFLVVFGVLALPTWKLAPTQLKSSVYTGLATSLSDIGNLFRPLRFQQVTGVWLNGDFRTDPNDLGLTWLLISVVAAAAVGGVVVCLRRREVALPVYTLSSLAVAVVSVFGNAWLEGKVLAAASPAVLAAAGVACALLAESGRRFEGLVARWCGRRGAARVERDGLPRGVARAVRADAGARGHRRRRLSQARAHLEYNAAGARYLLARSTPRAPAS